MRKEKAGRCRRSAEAAFEDFASPLLALAAGQAGEIARKPFVEGLHQLRLTMRSLQSLWWFYRPLMDAGTYTRQRSTFQSIARAAGQARDYDILIQLLNLQEKSTAVPAPDISTIRELAMEAGREVLSPSAMRALLEEILVQASAGLTARQGPLPLQAYADARVAKSQRLLRKRIAQALKVKKPDLAVFHDVRKAGKKTRDLLNLFGPVLSGSHRRMRICLRKSLKRLGDLNDVVVSERLLLENPALLSATGQPKKIGHWFEKERQRRLSAVVRLLRRDWR